MTTPGDFPPHEARGGLGNIMDPGGGGNTLKPSPLPNAITGGPGLSTAAASYPGGPSGGGPTATGIDDPQAFALLVSKLAGEWFGGSVGAPSLAPAPSVSSGWTGAGASPMSPGFSPLLAAATPPDSPSAAPSLSPATPLTSATSTPHGSSPAYSSSPHGSPPGSSPTSASTPHGSNSTAPHDGAVAPNARGTDSTGKGGVSSASMPAGSREGGASRSGGSTTSSTHPSSTHSGHPSSTGANPLAGTNARHANPAAAAPARNDVSNPFDVSNRGTSGPTTFGGTSNPFADTPDLSSLVDATLPFSDIRMPMFDASAVDAPGIASEAAVPSVPAGVAAGDRWPRIEGVDGHVGGFEGRDASIIRDLGGVGFDPYRVRKDFPILDEQVHGKRLVWLDNAATTQKPLAVIERLSEFYKRENSNIHRAAHTLAARATDAYEKARSTSAEFLNAPSANEIIFVRGATEGINLVAQTWGRKHVGPGDEIVITHLEHHANIVPWQQLCSEKGARLRVAPVDDRGDVIVEQYEKLLGPKTKLVALPQVSNALGTITPAREMVEIAHRYGARVLVDGAQAVSHMHVDVQMLDCDFYVFSGHKVFAPTGIGVVFGKREVLESMPPWQGGGNMIQDVTFERTTYQPPPFRFEAGTGNIADAAGLGTALEYVMKIGMDTIDRYEHDLLVYATERLAHVPGLTMIGTSPNKAGVLSFVLDGQRTEDVGAALDQEGIAVRSGHHCAQPILRRFGVEATVRASLAFYNICEDVDALVDALMRMQSRPG